jgi:uncharacterized protein (UPF0212 family)
MAKHQLMIDIMFSSISKTEKFVFILYDLEVFNAKLEKERALLKSLVAKKIVGHSIKEIKLHLLVPKLEKAIKKMKV